MSEFENPYIKDKTLEELIDGLCPPSGYPAPGSPIHEVMKAAAQAKMVERLAAPRRWAGVSLASAVVSAAAAVVSAVAAF
jgi:hypothetical protein